MDAGGGAKPSAASTREMMSASSTVGSCAKLRWVEVVMTDKESALIRSALVVLLERMGGEMAYTQTEYAAARARLGEYLIEGQVDRSGPGEPVIRVKLIPSTARGSMPVS